MRIRNLSVLLALILLLIVGAGAKAVPTITLTASRYAVLNDGRDSTEIIAEVRDSGGRFVPDGTVVTFTTNVGIFSRAGTTATASTRNGSARIRLSSPQKGTAQITAAVAGGGFQKMEIVFTDDPAETFQGNAYIAVQGSSALLYSAVDRVIEARGRLRGDNEEDPGLPGAHLSFRNVEVFADRLQVDCSANAVRADGNVTLIRGTRRLPCARLYYPLFKGTGYAITEVENHLRPVKIEGNELTITPLEYGINPRFLEMTDLSAAQLVVTARSILLFPGEKLQFKRPRFYQEGQPLFAMQFYSLGLYSSQLFSDQFLSVGTQGLGVDVPYYYDMSPSSTGQLRFRYGERAGRSAGATRPGVSIDMMQAYNSLRSNSRYTGEFGLTGINRSDWGMRWTHSQEFSLDTRGSLFIDLPQHRGIFASSNLSHRFGNMQLGLNLSANRSITGFRSSGMEGDLYLETMPRPVGKTGYLFAWGGTASAGRTEAEGFRSSTLSQGIQARFFSTAFRVDKNTTLTNYITVGQLWTNRGHSGTSALASVTAIHSLRGGGNLQLTYDFTRQPTVFTAGGSHRLTMSFYASRGSKWYLSLYGNTFLDAPNSSLIADFRYSVVPRWYLSFGATVQRFSSADYRDFTFGITRSIGGRDVTLSYSTLSHRIFFDIDASRF